MYILSLGNLGVCREELFIADLSEEAIPEVLEVSPDINEAFPFESYLSAQMVARAGVKVNGIIITPKIYSYVINN